MAEHLLIINGFLWRPYVTNTGKDWLAGPYCKVCKTTLIEDDNPFEVSSIKFSCEECNKTFISKLAKDVLVRRCREKMYADERSKLPVISLDTPPTKIEAYGSDENYFISARVTQKDGRRLGIVYMGEKKDEQDSKDYSQFFIDLDQDQIRYDNSNMQPDEIISTFVCEFKNNKTSTKFKKK